MNAIIRLLREDEGDYLLQAFARGKAPSYAVLSHTWSRNQEDEVTFHDIVLGEGRRKVGYEKLRFCGRQAKQDGLDFFWIDTCCIDKTDIEELQTSVSLMYQTYERAEKCYALLSDVSMGFVEEGEALASRDWESSFAQSRWFTRGWTLQELLAPHSVEFYSQEGIYIGSKHTLTKQLNTISGISIQALQGQELDTFDIDERLSWAKSRETTMEEDMAYCLFGIFGISMKIDYGEGRQKAWARLLDVIQGQRADPIDRLGQSDNMTTAKILLREEDKWLHWLSSSDFSAQQDVILSRRQEGTGQWFINAPDFISWVYGYSHTLLCLGIPGAGKTMIAAIAIDRLKAIVEGDNIGVAWVYYNYRFQASQGPSALLSALLKQLVRNRPRFTPIVKALHDSRDEPGSRLEELHRALSKVLASLDRTYIVVDALDECSDQYGARTKLIEQLQALQQVAKVHLFYTSRPVPEVVSSIPADAVMRIHTQDDDARLYIVGQYHRMPEFVQKSRELRETITDNIVSVIDGMFLLARLHCDTIANTSTVSQLETVLTSLRSKSTTLDDAYNEALKRIDGQLRAHQLLARKVMAWVTCCKRPLSVGELCGALAIHGREAWTGGVSEVNIEQALATCAGLVVVDETQTVRLVHYTTYDFLRRIAKQWLPEAPLRLAKDCLTYLTCCPDRPKGHPDAPGGLRSIYWGKNRRRLRRRALSDYPLLEYCRLHWGMHASEVESQVLDRTIKLLGMKDPFVHSHRIHQTEFLKYQLGMDQPAMAIFTAIIEGLPLAAQRLLMECADGALLNVRGSRGRTPLSWAAEMGFHKIVLLLLLRSDIQADHVDEESRTPFDLATIGGHTGIVKTLIQRREVKVDSKDSMGWTPLSWAATSGNVDMVETLIQRPDVDVNSRDAMGRTPLLHAAVAGHERVIELLLDHEDIEYIGDYHVDTPLSWAVYRGHKHVVKLLCRRMRRRSL